MNRRSWLLTTAVLPCSAAVVVWCAAVAHAHTTTPEQIVARLSAADVGRAFGIVAVERDRSLPRLLVIRVGPHWYEVDAALRTDASAEWMHLWRASVSSGILAIVDADSEQSVVAFDAEGRPHLQAPPPAAADPESADPDPRADAADLHRSRQQTAELVAAALAGDLSRARALLEAGADPDVVSIVRGESLLGPRLPFDPISRVEAAPLHAAAAGGNAEIVALLIEHEADVDRTTEQGLTPLMVSVLRDDASAVTALLDGDADPDALEPMWTEVLTSIGLADAMGAEPGTEVEMTALAAAAALGRDALVERLLARDADPDLAVNGALTPLMLAARAGRLASVRALVEAGADVDAADDGGCTALYGAASQGQRVVVEYLLARGAGVDAATAAGETPLTAAIARNDTQLARTLLAAGADPNVRRDDGASLLHVAAEHGYRPVTTLLLDAGVAIDVTMPGGATSLHVVARYDRDAVAAALLARGADVNAWADGSGTALDVAMEWQSERTADLLRNAGARTRDQRAGRLQDPADR